MTEKQTEKLKAATYRDIDRLIPQWTRLFKSLKKDIGDEYRASDDPEDNVPGMSVTIGFTPREQTIDPNGAQCSWHYQTGDNSYSGGAYGHAHWGVVSLHRRSNSREVAKDAADQIAESVSQQTTAAEFSKRSGAN